MIVKECIEECSGQDGGVSNNECERCWEDNEIEYKYWGINNTNMVFNCCKKCNIISYILYGEINCYICRKEDES